MPDEVITTTGMPDPTPAPVDPPAPEPTPAPPPVADPPAPETPPADPAPPPPPAAAKKPTLQERMNKLTADRDAANQRAVEAERALAEIKAAKPAEPTVAADAPRPQRDSFTTPEDYEAALVEWSSERAVRRALTEREQGDIQRRQQDAEQRQLRATEDASKANEDATKAESQIILETWQERRAQAVEKYPDFATVAESEAVPINEVMGRVILTDDNGPDIAYYLGQNPDEAKRIAGMIAGVYPPGHPAAGRPAPDIHRQLIEMGKIAARFEAGATRPEVSRAPPPIEPVRATGNTGTFDPETASMEEYAARRNAEMRQQRVH